MALGQGLELGRLVLDKGEEGENRVGPPFGWAGPRARKKRVSSFCFSKNPLVMNFVKFVTNWLELIKL